MLEGALDAHHSELSDREAPRRARLSALGRWVGGGVDWLARVGLVGGKRSRYHARARGVVRNCVEGADGAGLRGGPAI